MLQKSHHLGAREGPLINLHEEAALGRHAADHGEMVVGDGLLQYRRLPPRGIGRPRERQQVEAGFIYEDERGAEAGPLFTSAGYRCSNHSWMAVSSRWRARRIGCWRLKPQRSRSRLMWAGWYRTPNSRRRTSATRGHVQRSPRKPNAVAPRASSAGTCA